MAAIEYKAQMRGLGGHGIITDRRPYDLPPSAFSMGNNVRFNDGKASKAPIFRQIGLPVADDPILIGTIRRPSLVDYVVIANNDGRVYTFAGSEVEITRLGHTPAAGANPVTLSTLSQVFYYNRVEDPPLYLGPGDSNLQYLPDWDAGWRCRALRPFKDYLIAINMTKGAVEMPQTVKWSHFALAGAPPTSWDETDPTTVAGETTLSDLEVPLIDGGKLGNDFILYSYKTAYRMTFIGGTFVFGFPRLAFEKGIINANCWVEQNDRHYVFGVDDLYVHDGHTHESIVDGKVRKYLFSIIDTIQANKFFVSQDERLDEITFGFVSKDADAKWKNATPQLCNRGLVYNWKEKTSWFVDLPNVTNGVSSAVSTLGLTYATSVPETYGSLGGSYQDTADDYQQHHQMLSVADGDTITDTRLVGSDLLDQGRLSYPLVSELYAQSYVERLGIDYEHVPLVPRLPTNGRPYDLSTIFHVKAVFPQISLLRSGTTIGIKVGGQKTPTGPVTWYTDKPYNPQTQYRIGARAFGRYTALRFTEIDQVGFDLTGADLIVTMEGSR